MEQISIVYFNGSGELSTRTISDIHIHDQYSMDAYCHLRGHNSTFKFLSILQASDAETGEIIPNLWRHFEMASLFGGEMILLDALGAHINCIKALKFYTKLTRGEAKREVDKIVDFIKDMILTTKISDAEVDAFVRALWCGDVYEFKAGKTVYLDALISALPHNQRSAGRSVALSIAKGSGRRPIVDEDLQLIDLIFHV